MEYSITHSYLPFIADHINESAHTPSGIYCSECGISIAYGEEYYDVGGSYFCMRCENAAESAILDEVRDSYIYER